MKRILLCFCVSAALACGGSSGSGANGVSGTIHGTSFNAQDAISSSVAYTAGAGGTEALILVGSNTGLCDDIHNNRSPKNLKALLITVADIDGSGKYSAPTAPGTYPLDGSVSSKAAGVLFIDQDASCNTVDADTALAFSGTVTVASVSNGAYAGTFDVILTSGTNGSQQDHVTGSFGANACSGITGSGQSNATCF